MAKQNNSDFITVIHYYYTVLPSGRYGTCGFSSRHSYTVSSPEISHVDFAVGHYLFVCKKRLRVNSHLRPHPAPAAKPPAGRPPLPWTRWTLEKTRHRPALLLRYGPKVAAARRVGRGVGRGRGQRCFETGCLPSRGCTRQSCPLDKGRRLWDPACS